MKIIRIFVASSAELKLERMELVDLMQDLNEVYEEKSIKLKPVLWEYMDSSMRAERKEDEYLVELCKCEICIVMFWQTIGEYTVEELDVAVKEMRAGRNPKQVYLLFKENNDNISEELELFKSSFNSKYKQIPSYVFGNSTELRNIMAKILNPQNILML